MTDFPIIPKTTYRKSTNPENLCRIYNEYVETIVKDIRKKNDCLFLSVSLHSPLSMSHSFCLYANFSFSLFVCLCITLLVSLALCLRVSFFYLCLSIFVYLFLSLTIFFLICLTFSISGSLYVSVYLFLFLFHCSLFVNFNFIMLVYF